MAYVSDSLPDSILNPVDHIILERMHTCWHRLRRSLGLAPIRIGRKQARIKALQRFILTLSDQQLVTGIAILSTQYFKRCTMSEWHQTIVISLAWFSALTHMTTLIVLRDYLSNNSRLRLWRAIAMFGVMVMLFASMILAWINNGFQPAMPFQCQIIALRDPPAKTWDDTLGLTAILLFLFFYYGDNLLAIWSDRRITMLAWLKVLYWKRRGILPPERAPVLLQKLEEHSVQYKSRPSLNTKLNCIVAYFGFVRAEFASSFLWEIIWMVALFAFSLFQLVVQRWNQSWSVGRSLVFQGDENELGFGQIVALFLIALPFLGLFEAFGGK